MKKFSGVIFDFNGVLFWDTPLQEESWKDFALKYYNKKMTNEDLVFHMHGRNGRYTFEFILGRSISNEELAELTEQKESVYRQMCLELGEDFRLSPGAIQLFENLANQKIPFTIATASALKNLEFFIKHLKLDNWFDPEKIVYDDGTIAGKPAPDIYLEATKNISCQPGDCVVVEDSISGLNAANSAGIGHIIALGPASEHEKLLKVKGVNQVIISLEHFPAEILF